MAATALLLSDAQGVAPAEQARRERGLLAAAARGELHLHVSTLAGSVLSLGAHHAALPAELERSGAGAPEGARVWRRASGGRAVAAGDGFLILTVALPHRSALGAGQPLRPEQVMNRGVRGMLEALRRLGIDPTYPGLDAVTVARRPLAFLSFVEAPSGATLLEAVIAVEGSFAATATLLDRLDPAGAVATRLLSAAETTTLAAAAGARGAAWREPRAAAVALAEGYAAAFGLEVLELDPEVVPELVDDVPERVAVATPPEGARTASALGLLGPVAVWVRVAGESIADCGLGGDLIAPEALPRELCAALRDCAPSGAAIGARIAAVLDGDRAYLLGVRPDALCDLFAAAARAAAAS